MRFLIRVVFLAMLSSILLISVGLQAQNALTVDRNTGTIYTGDECAAGNVIYAEIQAALDCAASGATISVNRGTYAEALTFSKNLTLHADGDVVVTGSAESRVITVESNVSVTLIGVEIVGGAAEQGGGVYVDQGQVTIRDSLISRNTAQRGAGIYVASGSVDLIDTALTDNSVSILGTTADEVTEALGGAVYLAAGRVTMIGGEISRNALAASNCSGGDTVARGGGVYVESGDLTLSGTFVEENTVRTSNCGSGGATTEEAAALFAFAGSVTLSSDVEVIGEIITADDAVLTENAAPLTVPPLLIFNPESTAEPQVVSAPSKASTAIAWMNALLEAVRTERLSPPAASRIYAYGGVTLYEALVPGMEGYVSLSGQLNGLPAMPQPEAGAVYDWEIVANTALALVAKDLFSKAQPATLEKFDALQASIDLQRGEVAPVNVFNRSHQYGEAVAAVIIEWIATDNYAATRNLTYTLPAGNDAFWRPLETQIALEPYWGTLRPFAMPMSASCEVSLDVPFSSETGSAFYQQANQVHEAVVNITEEQRAIALFWADSPGETSTPPGHWVSIQTQLVQQLDMELPQAAEMYALTNIALADAFISCWQSKYRYQLLRPVTYIREYIDPEWASLIGTPPFPEYPSGHSVASSAASVVLTNLLGEMAFTDNSHAARNLPARSFVSFTEAADEAAMSRLYGGIHYPIAIENGLAQGRCIGEQIIERIQTRSAQ